MVIKDMMLEETKRSAEHFIFFTAYAELYLWILGFRVIVPD
jgi:hypothetical protein